jgi:hypothetical protein
VADSELVRFARPMHEMYVREKLQETSHTSFTPYLRLCIRYPYGKLGVDAVEIITAADKSHAMVDKAFPVPG